MRGDKSRYGAGYLSQVNADLWLVKGTGVLGTERADCESRVNDFV
jgi:hypothetical protein